MRRTVPVKPLYLHASLVVFACLVLAHLALAQEKKEIRIIPTNKEWTHTGIQVTPGQTYKVTVRGRFLQKVDLIKSENGYSPLSTYDTGGKPH